MVDMDMTSEKDPKRIWIQWQQNQIQRQRIQIKWQKIQQQWVHIQQQGSNDNGPNNKGHDLDLELLLQQWIKWWR